MKVHMKIDRAKPHNHHRRQWHRMNATAAHGVVSANERVNIKKKNVLEMWMNREDTHICVHITP